MSDTLTRLRLWLAAKLYPFSWTTSDQKPIRVVVAEDASPPDFERLPTGYKLESFITPRKLSALYLEHAWCVNVGGGLGVPMPTALVEFMARHVAKVAGDDDCHYVEAGRMLFLRDDYNPDVVHCYLLAATASPLDAGGDE